MLATVERPVKTLAWWLCQRCGRKLCRQYLAPGSVVEARCHSCKTIQVLEVREAEERR